MNTDPSLENEWLETDGLGGFSSGTSQGVNTRRYHALLLSALHPPSDRHVLLNDLVVVVTTPRGTYRVSQHYFAPDVLTERDAKLVEFTAKPWPTFRYQIEDFFLIQEVLLHHGSPVVVCGFRLERPLPGVRLSVRPLLSGRSFHALHRENSTFQFGAVREGAQFIFQPYAGVPGIRVLSNGSYRTEPLWYRQFRYLEEAKRGLDDTEDLAAPGVFDFDIGRTDANLVFGADGVETRELFQGHAAESLSTLVRTREQLRRAAFSSALELAGDAYLVKRGAGKTIVAGYPWFGDWGRDTFIALRGLCLATGRLDDAREILLAWAGAVSAGMLPNRFADSAAEQPEYNSVDASLWYVIATAEFLALAQGRITQREQRALLSAVEAILRGYSEGTRHGIKLCSDGLLAAGEAGVQLTWMDAKVGDWVVTPRIGKPVEVQALWLNALQLIKPWFSEFEPQRQLGLHSFQERFPIPEKGYLRDVVDADHVASRSDESLRPNQLLALGGLPVALLPAERCREILERIESELWTPLGPRSLARSDRNYRANYSGGVWERDAAYHQGTVWPWLAGPFVEAWVKARGSTPQAAREARDRFVRPLYEHLNQAGLGHVSEIADGAFPHVPCGCPFQAWSIAELIRVEALLRGLSNETGLRYGGVTESKYGVVASHNPALY